MFNESDLRAKGFVPDGRGGYSKVAHVTHQNPTDTGIQKLQESNPGQSKRPVKNTHRSKNKEEDAGIGGGYSVRIIVNFPDKRTRDLDGILVSVLDTLVAARRRFVEIHTARGNLRPTI